MKRIKNFFNWGKKEKVRILSKAEVEELYNDGNPVPPEVDEVCAYCGRCIQSGQTKKIFEGKTFHKKPCWYKFYKESEVKNG